MSSIIELIIYSIHIVLPFMAFLIVYYNITSMWKNFRGNGPLVVLVNKITKEKIAVNYWENSIGRSKSCDIVLDGPTVSRDHAVMFRRDKGWFISDTNSKTGVLVNNKKINGCEQIYIDDIINIGGVPLLFKRADVIKNDDYVRLNKRKKSMPTVTLMMAVTIFQLLASLELCFVEGVFNYKPLIVFGLLSLIFWSYFIISKYIFKIVNFELETLGVFLSGIGIITLCGADIDSTYNQIIALALGMALFSFIIFFIKNPDRVVKFRIFIAVGAIGMLVLNLVLGTVKNGSQNWIMLGNISIQPSEFVKVAFILVGTSTLERLQTTKNLTEFIIFSVCCMGALFLMGDFGTACIFFVTFIIISFMRSGSIRTVILICSGAFIGGMMILKFKPYIMNRFSVWRHSWEHVNDMGYQQTRVMTYSASGGLLGIGLGKGSLKHIFASTSDLVFGMLCEEWGLILAIISVLCISLIALYGRHSSLKSRSTFYSIASCSAAGMLLFQMSLNVFGCTDILPLTGVTLPFISLGGSSMISVWGMLAFIKASDERTYAMRR